MPELPEVETVRLGLAPVMEGAVLDKVTVNRPDLRFPFPPRFARRLTGRRIVALGRRAKYLLADLDDLNVLVMHLGMSGSFRIEAGHGEKIAGQYYHARSAIRAHDHVVFDLSNGAHVVFNDPRRFGMMDIVPRSGLDEAPYFKGLGLEPLGNALSGETIAALFAGRTAPLKAMLLEQRRIAGIGNIYACEAMWRAKLSPVLPAGKLAAGTARAREKSDALATAIRDVLAEAIAAGGSSLRDHRRADGEIGLFQHSFAVYDREGEPCPRATCHGVIRRRIQSGRSTFYCPVCQK